MKNNALTFLLLVASVALSNRVAFGQPLAGKRFQDLSQNHFATATALRKGYEISFPGKLHKLVLDPLPAGNYSVGSGGYFHTLDSAFGKLSVDGVAGAVTLELIDSLYAAPAGSLGFFLNGPIPGAGPNSRITIRPMENKNVTLEGDGLGVMNFVNTSYVTVDGVGLTGRTTLTVHCYQNTLYDWNDGLHFIDNSDHNVIQRVIIISDDYARLSAGLTCYSLSGFSTPDSNLIQYNFIKKAMLGIQIHTADASARATGNTIRGNIVGSETDSLIAWGIDVEGAENTTVEDNIVQNMRGSLRGIAKGINSYYGRGDTIRNNTVHTIIGMIGGVGIAVGGDVNVVGSTGYNNMVYNNMVSDVGYSSSPSYLICGIRVRKQINVKIYYNSVFLSGTGSISGGSAALYIESASQGIDARNNILVNSRNEAPYCASAIYDYDASNIVTTDYNDLYYEPTQYSCLVRIGNTKYNTLADWQATGNDAHSVNVMPPFRQPYLHIDSTNAAAKLLNGQGIPLAAVAYDFDGQIRNFTSPDIGADEFVIPVPPTWGAVWTKDPPSPVLSGGADGSWNRHVFMPCVLYNADSARYEMWFAASYGPNTPNWRPYRIGFAVSKDGIHWTMSSPTPVLSPDPGTWEAYTVESPAVIRENGQYKMWYTGSPDFIVSMIGYATSPDGIHWTKYSGNPVMGVGKAAWESGGPFSCTVMPFGGGYRMWYGAFEAMPSTVSRIGYATSGDGITWQRDTVNNPVVGTGTAGQWDAGWVLSPQVLQIGDTHFMWYTGCQNSTATRYGGLAISNDLGKTWTRHALNPVLQPSYGGWDGTYVELGTVLLRGDTLHMWYSGAGSATGTFLWSLGHATSKLITTGITERGRRIPQQFMLFQNYPNPFNPTTVISYQLPAVSDVRLVVYDVLGREVAVLVNERKPAGSYTERFDALGLASGVYFFRLTAGQYVECRKMVLMK